VFDYYQEELEDTKDVIRIHKSKTYRQHNSQKKKDKSAKHTHKAKDQLTRTQCSKVAVVRSSKPT
jgi:hypothetical protein